MYQYEAFMAILESQEIPKKQQGKLKPSSSGDEMKLSQSKSVLLFLMVSALAGELLSSIW